MIYCEKKLEDKIQEGSVFEMKIGYSKEWVTVIIDRIEENHISLRLHMYHSAFSKHRFHKSHIKKVRLPILH